MIGSILHKSLNNPTALCVTVLLGRSPKPERAQELARPQRALSPSVLLSTVTCGVRRQTEYRVSARIETEATNGGRDIHHSHLSLRLGFLSWYLSERIPMRGFQTELYFFHINIYIFFQTSLEGKSVVSQVIQPGSTMMSPFKI
jgi:hypothetical protein